KSKFLALQLLRFERSYSPAPPLTKGGAAWPSGELAKKTELGREPQASQDNANNFRRHRPSDCGGWRDKRADDALLDGSHLFDCRHLCAVASVGFACADE